MSEKIEFAIAGNPRRGEGFVTIQFGGSPVDPINISELGGCVEWKQKDYYSIKIEKGRTVYRRYKMIDAEGGQRANIVCIAIPQGRSIEGERTPVDVLDEVTAKFESLCLVKAAGGWQYRGGVPDSDAEFRKITDAYKLRVVDESVHKPMAEGGAKSAFVRLSREELGKMSVDVQYQEFKPYQEVYVVCNDEVVNYADDLTAKVKDNLPHKDHYTVVLKLRTPGDVTHTLPEKLTKADVDKPRTLKLTDVGLDGKYYRFRQAGGVEVADGGQQATYTLKGLKVQYDTEALVMKAEAAIEAEPRKVTIRVDVDGYRGNENDAIRLVRVAYGTAKIVSEDGKSIVLKGDQISVAEKLKGREGGKEGGRDGGLVTIEAEDYDMVRYDYKSEKEGEGELRVTVKKRDYTLLRVMVVSCEDITKEQTRVEVRHEHESIETQVRFVKDKARPDGYKSRMVLLPDWKTGEVEVRVWAGAKCWCADAKSQAGKRVDLGKAKDGTVDVEFTGEPAVGNALDYKDIAIKVGIGVAGLLLGLLIGFLVWGTGRSSQAEAEKAAAAETQRQLLESRAKAERLATEKDSLQAAIKIKEVEIEAMAEELVEYRKGGKKDGK